MNLTKVNALELSIIYEMARSNFQNDSCYKYLTIVFVPWICHISNLLIFDKNELKLCLETEKILPKILLAAIFLKEIYWTKNE